MSCAAIFSCNECGREKASGEFKGHRSGMRDSALFCLVCDTKQPHTFIKFIWEDTNPDEWEQLVLVPARLSDVPWDNLAAQGKEMKAPAPVSTQSATRRDDSSRIQFFNVDRLAGIEQTVTIKGVEFVKSNYGDVSFTLEMNGRTYLWDRKLNSNAYAVIIAAYGDETDNWIGKSLVARPYFNPKFKQTEVQVEVPKASKKR